MRTNSILKGLLLTLLMMVHSLAMATTFKVTNTDDSGPGSLRWAVELANEERSLSSITFDLPEGQDTIMLQSELLISSKMKVDGSLRSQRVVLKASDSNYFFYCKGVPVGDSLIFRSIEFGHRVGKKGNYNGADIFLADIEGEGCATAVLEDLKMTEPTTSGRVIAADERWRLCMYKCEVSGTKNCNAVKYGKYAEFKNSYFHDNELMAIVKTPEAEAYNLASENEVPKIDTVYCTCLGLVVEGTAGPNAEVELFLSDDSKQTALTYLSTMQADAEGKFRGTIEKSLIPNLSKLYLSATATYGGTSTSALSDAQLFLCEDVRCLDYYVKTDGQGDGSSWEDAMSPDSFAYILPKAPSGAVFHVAEGVYLPVLNWKGEKSDGNDRRYTINSSVSIVGGYPSNAVTGAVSNPKSFKTVFDGSFEDNADEQSYAYYLFYAKDSAANVSMEGVELKNAQYAFCSNAPLSQENAFKGISFENSRFEHCNRVVSWQDKVDKVDFKNVEIAECHSSDPLMYGQSTVDTMSFFNVKFEKNVGYYLLDVKLGESGVFLMDSVSATDNSTSLLFKVSGSGRFVAKNSDFKNNVLVNQCFLLNTKEALFDNCSFVGNKNGSNLISVSGVVTKISTCEFAGNSVVGDFIATSETDSTMFHISNSIFENNSCGSVHNIIKLDRVRDSIISCLFSANKVGSGAIIFSSVHTEEDLYFIANNTFVDNEVGYVIHASGFKMLNNTIVGNKAIWSPVAGNSGMHYVYGNIILGNEVAACMYGYCPSSYMYYSSDIRFNMMNVIQRQPPFNKYDTHTWIPDNETNIYIRPFNYTEEMYEALPYNETREHISEYPQYTYSETEQSILETIFEGTYDPITHVFKPVLKDNGGFTKTVALKTDRLADGTSIRFPREEVGLMTDQRGVPRLESTCMGAYEMSRCGFDDFNLRLRPSLAPNYDTTEVKIMGIPNEELGNYKYEWQFDPNDLKVVGTPQNSMRFHLHTKKEKIDISVKISDACGFDTTLTSVLDVYDLFSMKVVSKSDNNCMSYPDAKVKIAMTIMSEDWNYELKDADGRPVGAAPNIVGMELRRTIDIPTFTVPTIELEYDSLPSGSYVFVVSDACGVIDSLVFDIVTAAFDMASLVVLDSVAVNAHSCYGAEKGDFQVFYSQNVQNANVGVRLSSNGEVVAEAFSSNERDTLRFSDLDFGRYEVKLYYVGAERCTENAASLVDSVEIEKKEAGKLLLSSFDYSKSVRCSGAENAYLEVAFSDRDATLPIYLVARSEEGRTYERVVLATENFALLDDLAPGNYHVSISYDRESVCSPAFDSVISISPLAPLQLSEVELKHQVTCHHPADGAISFQVSGWAESHFVALVAGGDTISLRPDSVVGQLAYFSRNQMTVGDSVFVQDYCGDKQQESTRLKPFDDYKIEVVAEHNRLKCSYSSDGFIELKVSGGYSGANALGSTVKGDKGVFNRETDEPLIRRYSDLPENLYAFVYYSNVEGCKDGDTIYRRIYAPEPVKFLSGISPAACADVNTGEFTVIPYVGAYPNYVDPENSLNYAIAVLDDAQKAVALQHFSGLADISFYILKDGEKLDAREVLEESLYETDEDGNRYKEQKSFPAMSLWREKDDFDYQYPEKWIGFDLLPAETFIVEVTNDSACVFSDTLKINNPERALRIDSIRYEGELARCHAEHRYAEVFVSGGWGGYLYSFRPKDQSDEEGSGLVLSQTYDPGDVFLEENGRGYYKSPILPPGEYRVAVMDKQGCRDSLPTLLDVQADIWVDGAVKLDSCGGSEASIVVRPTVAAGYEVFAPYAYTVRYENKTLGDTVVGPTDEMEVKEIPKGIIGIFVHDAKGCSGYSTFDVVMSDTSFVPLSAYALTTHPEACHGDSSGALVFKAFGAYPPYKEFYVDQSESPMPYDSIFVSQVDTLLMVMDNEGNRLTDYSPDGLYLTVGDTISFVKMAAGSHTLTIVDSKGCKKSFEYEIKRPAPLSMQTKASSVCPNALDSGKIVASETLGGVPPYRYAFKEDFEEGNFSADKFSSSKFLAAKRGETKTMMVMDTNGCVAVGAPRVVTESFNSDGLKQNCLVSTWHYFDDVLVFIDISEIPNGMQYDSTNFVIADKDVPDTVSYEFLDPLLFTYGIPDTVASITFNGVEVEGPLWGVPSEIVAGMKSQKLYLEEKMAIASQKQEVENAMKKAIEENDVATQDSCEGKLKELERRHFVNCTREMIESSFLCLVSSSEAKRMKFLKFDNSKDISNVLEYEPGSESHSYFDYGFTHILYVNGCDMAEAYNGISVAKNGYTPYEEMKTKDILSLDVSPNPTKVGEECLVSVVLSRKVDFSVSIYDMLGKLVFSGKSTDADLGVNEGVETSWGDGKAYQFSFRRELSNSSVIVVSTDKDRDSRTVIVMGGRN